ncbi:MAG: DUF1501 domain-containing protein [Acidobacteriota bacterium]|nr:DUF1501 domain-containing protein [Acidobacteriota bacterium]
MKRKTFLKALGGSAFGSVLATGGVKHKRFKTGKGGSLKKLVVLFQRGGNDGLNTLVPVETVQYDYYKALRPTVGFAQNQLLNIPGSSGFFAAAPSLAPLLDVFQAGDLTFVHAVNYPGSDLSHFESQAFMETGVPGDTLMDGWINRFLSSTTGPGIVRGITVGNLIPQSVSGPIPVPVSENFGKVTIDGDPIHNSAEKDAYEQQLRDLFALSPTMGNTDIYGTGNGIFNILDGFSDRNLEDYIPENGAAYPNTTLGQRVAHAAQILKDESSFLGVEVVTIDQPSYDTHDDQLGRQPYLLENLTQSMKAFYTDMGPVRMQDVVFLVVTEFGRRAYQNDSFGTDHGIGGVAMVMGSAASGIIINEEGDWPGLHSDDLSQGSLAWRTDYRDIYWEILSSHMGLDNTTLNTIIPGHTYTPQGVLL